ncbi:MAG: hypothetical protein JST16_15070 [Bdellovibrionales bacterium]|nr:hypothetical protein [Bdellovibrionales bacterium]
MANSPYLWIQTPDGSPTLWHDELGEFFRSVKGAFTESWVAFVQPGLAHASGLGHPVRVGEFGLGTGTNWALWTLAAHLSGLRFSYFVIERDQEPFRLGRARWLEESAFLADFFRPHFSTVTADDVRQQLATAPDPEIFASLDDAVQSGRQCELWFHDPFGASVNPEGYSKATLQKCAQLWAPNTLGVSYACNRAFRTALETLPDVSTRVVPFGQVRLKRERLEFRHRTP